MPWPLGVYAPTYIRIGGRGRPSSSSSSARAGPGTAAAKRDAPFSRLRRDTALPDFARRCSMSRSSIKFLLFGLNLYSEGPVGALAGEYTPNSFPFLSQKSLNSAVWSGPPGRRVFAAPED